MRLPTTDGKRISANIDEAEAVRMIRHAIDHGVNYVDTAYPYHGGNSELVLGKALRDGYRGKVKLATKLPTWMVQGPADFDRLLDEQLRKLETEHIDFYLLHSLSRTRWRDIVLKHDLLAKSEQALADGRIGYLGFSFHDDYQAFEEIVNGYERWTFCQIQYNYMDTETQAGSKGLALAAGKGLAVVVMEPLLGGRLADPPLKVRELLGPPQRAKGTGDPRGNAGRTPADWALQWLWDQPEVSIVLSGMTRMKQVEENLSSARRAQPRSFSKAEFELIERVRSIYRERTAVPCNECSYCMPCPNGVNIPNNFHFFNYAHLYDDLAGARFKYQVFIPPEQRAEACLDCNSCEEQCPQKIPVSEWMPRVSALLGEAKPS
jgi:predicted aldo/keto reductase-like oxidoreductase